MGENEHLSDAQTQYLLELLGPRKKWAHLQAGAFRKNIRKDGFKKNDKGREAL